MSLNKGRHEEAKAPLQRALEIRPGNAPGHKILGRLAIEQQDWPKAAALWQEIVLLYDLYC